MTNSKGDVASLQLSVTIENTSLYAPRITLKNYLMYITVGDTVDLRDNLRAVESVTENAEDDVETEEETAAAMEALRERVRIETDFDRNTPGVYQVDYRFTDAFDREAHAVLTIVVEERTE